MKKIRLVLLLLATMFCSNVLYAQTYAIMNDAKKTVAFTIDESKGIYAGDIRGEKSVFLGKFEGDEFKMASQYNNVVLSYKNGCLYVNGVNDPMFKMEEGKTYFRNDNKGWTFHNAIEDNKVFFEGKLMWEYTESVPDKIHLVLIFCIVATALLAK